jgi:polysaccharide export outer membrane protein
LGGCVDTSDSKPGSLGAPVAAAPSADHADLAQAAATFTSASTPGNSAYKIGPQDVLEITVFKVPDLTRSVQVADSGSINLPLVGEVPAAGKTAQDIERDLTARLGAKYLQSPQVGVFVKEFNSQRVTVEGAVRKPGVYPVRGKTTLLQFIALAEGLDRDTASSNAVVFRQSAGGRSAARFNIDDINGGKAEDPVIEQGDVIVVDTSQSKMAFSYFTKALPVATLFRPF